MYVLLDIKDSKASFVLELLKNFKFIKTKELTPVKKQYMEELSEAVNEINLVKQGKLKARPIEELLNEL